MKALLLGAALAALLTQPAMAAQDRLALRLYLTKQTPPSVGRGPDFYLTEAEIAAAQACLDAVRAGERFPHKPEGRIDSPSEHYPPGVADAAEQTSDCLAARGMGHVAVRPSMSIVTPHLLR